VIGVVEIEAAKEVTLDLTAAFARLIPQLSRSSPAPTPDELAEIIAHPGSTLFVAKLDGEIVGTLTLVLFRIPTALRAWIEDVVVDEAAGRRGIATALTRAAIDHAAAAGARTVDLTSRPSREGANALYQKMGFQLRETNVYRYEATGD
jgi:ribosomal protein S18 acetylase RimI-like enzyme